MYHKVMTITPAEARDWLDTKNSRNRPVSQTTVDRYVQEIKAGNWKLNGQPIIFGKSGQLLNGQHRLKAIVQANKSIETAVLFAVDDETFDTIDDGNNRSLADVFAINGETNSALLAPGVRFIWNYTQGTVGKGTQRGKIGTKHLLEKTLDKHPGLRRSVKLYSMLKSRTGGLLVPGGFAIGLHYLFSLVDEKKADEFFTVLQSGLGLSEGHPIALLRQKLIASRASASSRMTDTALYYYMVTTWNAFVKDQPIKRLAMATEEKTPEIDDLPKSLMKELI